MPCSTHCCLYDCYPQLLGLGIKGQDDKIQGLQHPSTLLHLLKVVGDF